MTEEYYVYAYLREDGTPYYIGKGRGDRAYKHRTKGTKRPKDIQRIRIMYDNLTESDAFNREIELITKYGRKDLNTGILLNRTNGGEGASGAIIKDRKCSPEAKKRISEYQKGKKHKDSTKEKMSEIHKKRWSSMNNNDKEKIFKKISDSNSGVIRTKEHKDKLSEWFTGSIYINNGVENKRIKPSDNIPDDWVKGRLSYKTKRILSEETKKKIGDSNRGKLIGKVPWNKGKTSVKKCNNVQKSVVTDLLEGCQEPVR
jgi:hypothetical protein